MCGEGRTPVLVDTVHREEAQPLCTLVMLYHRQDCLSYQLSPDSDNHSGGSSGAPVPILIASTDSLRQKGHTRVDYFSKYHVSVFRKT
jgi:hypothetical protein